MKIAVLVMLCGWECFAFGWPDQAGGEMVAHLPHSAMPIRIPADAPTKTNYLVQLVITNQGKQVGDLKLVTTNGNFQMKLAQRGVVFSGRMAVQEPHRILVRYKLFIGPDQQGKTFSQIEGEELTDAYTAGVWVKLNQPITILSQDRTTYRLNVSSFQGLN